MFIVLERCTTNGQLATSVSCYLETLSQHVWQFDLSRLRISPFHNKYLELLVAINQVGCGNWSFLFEYTLGHFTYFSYFTCIFVFSHL